MIVSCTACGTELQVDAALVPPQGATVHCTTCGAAVLVAAPAAPEPPAKPNSLVEHEFVPGSALELELDRPVGRALSLDLPPAPAPFSRPIDTGTRELVDPNEPEFVDADDVLPSFEGSLSADGDVDKAEKPPFAGLPVLLPPAPELELVGSRPTQVAELAAAPEVSDQPLGHPRFANIAISCLLVVLSVASALAFRAGGVTALGGHHSVHEDLALEHLALLPYPTASGRYFWVVSGQLHNLSASERQAVAIELRFGSGPLVIASPGATMDALKLYEHALAETSAAATKIAGGERLAFVAALPADGGLATIEGLHAEIKGP